MLQLISPVEVRSVSTQPIRDVHQFVHAGTQWYPQSQMLPETRNRTLDRITGLAPALSALHYLHLGERDAVLNVVEFIDLKLPAKGACVSE